MGKFNEGDHVEFDVNRRGHGKKVGIVQELKRHRSGVYVLKIAVLDKRTDKTEFWRIPETNSTLKKTFIPKGNDSHQKIQKAIQEKDQRKSDAADKAYAMRQEVSKIGLKNVKVLINYRGGSKWQRIDDFTKTGVYPVRTFRRKAVAWRFILEVKNEPPIKE